MCRRASIVRMGVLVAMSVGVSGAAHAAPYLGKRPPGGTPRVFAPGVVSTGDIHSRLAISPDGREMYWSAIDTTTWTTRLVGTRELEGRWTVPATPDFAKDAGAQSPMFAPDGNRLYYRIRAGQGWSTVFVERSASGWSAPRRDGVLLDCSSSFSRTGRVYFSSRLESKAWSSGIFSARFTADGYSDSVTLDTTINVPGAIDYTPHVAPDESFLLFTSNRPHVGDREDMHVHVSFRMTDGTWSTPRRVSEVPGRFPSLSPDGRYLFFCGDDGNFYWVDAKIIERLRPARASARVPKTHRLAAPGGAASRVR